MALNGFGVTEFQLVLLRRMQDYQPELVENARAQLGVTRTEQRDANAQWQRLVRSRTAPGGLRRFRYVLGEPEGRSTVHIGDMPCLIHQWRLPLWPDLRWEVLTGPDNREIHSWLVRAPGEPVPRLSADGRLEPWSCVVGDIEQTYASVRHHEGSAPTRWTVEFEANDGTVWLARFTHGLFQTVDEPPPLN